MKVVKTIAHDQTQKCSDCGQNMGRLVEMYVEDGDVVIAITGAAFCWEDSCSNHSAGSQTFASTKSMRSLFFRDSEVADEINIAIDKLEELKGKFK